MNTARPESPQPVQPTFGALLRQYRLAAGVSQEELAERAGLSVQGLSALENGRRQAPYRHTVTLLARALRLSEAETALLAAAVVRVRAPAPVTAPAPGGHDQESTPEQETGRDTSPALPAPRPARTNLPVPLTSFIGREREQGEVRALRQGAARLVTLTGPGGSCPTRLALAVAGAVLSEHPDGVWLVELASLTDPALVTGTVAQALGLREDPYRPLLSTLVDHLKERYLLLVLDNCEHLVGTCAELVAALLQSCPHLRVLATSRETLEVPGETTYRVPSLAVPDLAHLPDPEHLAAYAAVELFVQRAQSRRPDFTITTQNAGAVAEICSRLDGMPLAIELAAARLSSLPVEAIAARLDDRFRLLTGGPRTAMSRQQTLRAALDWSHDLLAEPEQILLRRLSVFAGGWTLDAAETVCAGDGIEEWEILDRLDALVNKSLVLLHEAGPDEEQGRYEVLETVRQYGWERLAASGETEEVRDRHLAWCMALAEQAEPQLTGQEQGHWLARLEREHDNLRLALGWARAQGKGELGLRLAAALWRFWDAHGHFSEGRSWLEPVLGDPGPISPAVKASALHVAGNLAGNQGDLERAGTMIEDALVLQHALGDTLGIAASLTTLAKVAGTRGDHARAASLLEEALALRRTLGDRLGMATSLNTLGIVTYAQGDYARAGALLEESLMLFRALGDKQGIALALQRLGSVAFRRGEHGRAVALFEEALALLRNLGDKQGIAIVLSALGEAAYQGGEYGRAAALLEECIRLSRTIGSREMVAAGLELIAWVTAAHRKPRWAVRLGGAADALREALGVPLYPDLRAGHAHVVRILREGLGEDDFATAWAEGRALPLDEAITLALEKSTESDG
jgi:non-specific serine/threonine protein kinase